MGGWGRSALDLEEMNMSEEPTAGVVAVYIWLTPPMCSPAACVDIAFNEILLD